MCRYLVGSLHLFSQGTGDLLLDLCSDFWDGHDLCPLKEGDRYCSTIMILSNMVMWHSGNAKTW